MLATFNSTVLSAENDKHDTPTQSAGLMRILPYDASQHETTPDMFPIICHILADEEPLITQHNINMFPSHILADEEPLITQHNINI